MQCHVMPFAFCHESLKLSCAGGARVGSWWPNQDADPGTQSIWRSHLSSISSRGTAHRLRNLALGAKRWHRACMCDVLSDWCGRLVPFHLSVSLLPATTFMTVHYGYVGLSHVEYTMLFWGHNSGMKTQIDLLSDGNVVVYSLIE